MCNEVRRRIMLGQLREDWGQTGIPLRFPEGAPNMAPLDSIRITDPAVILRASGEGTGAAEAVTRRWSWPGPAGRPVYNYRSEGRAFAGGRAAGRCLLPVDGFFEFTAPEPGQRRKTRWLVTHAAEPWFALAGWWRRDDAVGEAFALLTCEPGPDIAPIHPRQMVVVPRERWAGWVDGSVAAGEVCRPLPAGTLRVERTG